MVWMAPAAFNRRRRVLRTLAVFLTLIMVGVADQAMAQSKTEFLLVHREQNERAMMAINAFVDAEVCVAESDARRLEDISRRFNLRLNIQRVGFMEMTRMIEQNDCAAYFFVFPRDSQEENQRIEYMSEGLSRFYAPVKIGHISGLFDRFMQQCRRSPDLLKQASGNEFKVADHCNCSERAMLKVNLSHDALLALLLIIEARDRAAQIKVFQSASANIQKEIENLTENYGLGTVDKCRW